MAQTHAVRRLDVRFDSDGDTCAAWLFLPEGVANPPVVILGHGLGATREMRLDAFAELRRRGHRGDGVHLPALRGFDR